MSFKSGFIALVGQPNTGKSTLVNALVNEKVAIVSSKAQTTRNAIRGILTTDEYQMILIDTPGIHDPKDNFGRFLNKESFSNIDGSDVVYFIIDATKSFNKKNTEIATMIKENYDIPVFGIINKIDKLSKPQLIELLMQLESKQLFDELVPISALEKDNLKVLLNLTLQYLPEGPLYFDPSDHHDRSLEFQISETIREKVLYYVNQELPHHTDVVVEKIDQTDEDWVIYAKIIVSRDSHKPILVGKQGSMIRNIRLKAQSDLRKLLNRKIDLELFVSVEKDWRNKEGKLKDLGYLND